MHINGELVFLVTAHVCVTHKEQRVAVLAGRRSNKLQPYFRFLLQRQALYRHKIVHLYISDDHPPSFLAFLHSWTNPNYFSDTNAIVNQVTIHNLRMYYRSGTGICCLRFPRWRNTSAWIHIIAAILKLWQQIENLTVNRCIFMWRTFLPNFIQIRFETMEH